jgi:hypothetical protein
VVKIKKSILAIIFLFIGGYFWFSGTTDVHTNKKADIELIKSEVSEHLGISLTNDDLFFVSREDDFGTPFNHAAVNFIYLDAIINKKSLKEKLLAQFNQSNLETNKSEDVFLSLALSIENICEYTNRTNITNTTFCDNDNLEHHHLTISSDSDFGHIAMFYETAQDTILLRRFWALDSDF